MSKPIASLSLDLDNEWSYLKIHGDAMWKDYPSYLDVVVPRILDILADLKLTITFFIVGQDATLEKNAAALRAIAAAGHEVGNHSFAHEPWMATWEETAIERELAMAEVQIERVTGHRPVGFRGPGFCMSPTMVRVLARRGYFYDASVFPSFIGPVARAYYFATARLNADEKKQRGALFGSATDGFQPLAPFRWSSFAGDLIEIPVTTFPVVRVPAHLSYVLYLAGLSPRLALTYFRSFLTACRATGTRPSVLLHPLDFLGKDDRSNLTFFPGMGLGHREKTAIVREALAMLAEWYSVVPMAEHAAVAAATHNLATRPIRESSALVGGSPRLGAGKS